MNTPGDREEAFMSTPEHVPLSGYREYPVEEMREKPLRGVALPHLVNRNGCIQRI